MGSCSGVIGEQIGNFKIVSQLGKGGMGEVYLGEHEKIGTRVAVKMLLPHVSANTELVERFFNEAIAVSKILHAGTGKIFDVGFHPSGRAYLVMEFLPGETLASRIRRLGKLPVAQVGELGKQISSVLEAVHKAGITHRDLKPDNIFVVPDDELASGERVKIVDFGIAKLSGMGGGMTATSSGSMGTPAYMSPEQWKNTKNVDWRADAYSLGCLAFEMVAGRPPFIAQTIGEACSMHLTEAPPRLASVVAVPPSLDALIASLLEKSPEQRPATMRDIANAFGAVANTSTNLASTQMSGQIAMLSTMPAQAGKDAATMVSGVGMDQSGANRQPIANRETLPAAEGEPPSMPVLAPAQQPPAMPVLAPPSASPMHTTTLGRATGSAQIASRPKPPRALIFAAAGLAVVGIAIVVAFAIGSRRNKAADKPDKQALRAGVRKAAASCGDAIPKWKCMQERAARAETPALAVALYGEAIALCIDVKCQDDDRAYLKKLRDEQAASLGPDTIVADLELTEVSVEDAGSTVDSNGNAEAPKPDAKNPADAAVGSANAGSAANGTGSAIATSGSGSAARAARAADGILTVDVKPGVATVFLDGKKIGRTPITSRPVPSGPHSLKLVSSNGYYEYTIVIASNKEFNRIYEIAPNNVGAEVGGEAVESPAELQGLGPSSSTQPEKIDRQMFDTALRSYRSAVVHCKRSGMTSITVEISVGSDARMSLFKVQRAPDGAFERCVREALGGVEFPKTRRGGSIVYEVQFTAAQ